MSANLAAARDAVAAEVRGAIAKQKTPGTKIARALGISQSALSRRLNGDTPFDVEQLFAIAKLLDVPLSQLLPTGEDERSCMNSVALTFVAA